MRYFFEQCRLACLLAAWLPVTAHSAGLVEFSSNNLQLLRGWDYQIGGRQQTIITAEHFNRWRFGDFFVFADYSIPDGGNETYYLEPTLRFSLSRLTGKVLQQSLVQDVLLAINVEKPKGLDPRFLAGIAVDLKPPGFDFLKAHLFYRDDPEADGATHQLTLVWKHHFAIGGVKVLSEGFADFAGAEDDVEANQLVVPRLLVNLGQFSTTDWSNWYAGIEYSYWRNKFGIDGLIERVPQLQLKWEL